MVDLDKGSEQLDKADGFLTKLKVILKKHWGILMLIGLGALGYFIITDDTPVEDEVGYQDEYYDETAGEEEYGDDTYDAGEEYYGEE